MEVQRSPTGNVRYAKAGATAAGGATASNGGIVTKYESAWRVLFVVLASIGVVLVTKIVEFQTSPTFAHVPKGHLQDLWFSIVVALSVGGVRHLISRHLRHAVLAGLSPKKVRSPEDAQRRADQICKWMFDLVYYTCSSTCAYVLLRDQKFLPPYLGGPADGSCSNIFQNYPFVSDIPLLRLFYQVQAGNHLYTFVHHVLRKQGDPKFYEYVLHHGLALFLIVYSYLLNFTQIGAVVLMLHDPCDVTLILYRGYADLKYRKMALSMVFAVFTYTSFIYLRIFAQPVCVVKSAAEYLLQERPADLDSVVYLPIAFQVTMLAVLSLMQFYWVVYMTKGALNLFFKGKDKDGYDN